MDGQRKMFRMAERKEGVSMNEVFEKIIEKFGTDTNVGTNG